MPDCYSFPCFLFWKIMQPSFCTHFHYLFPHTTFAFFLSASLLLFSPRPCDRFLPHLHLPFCPSTCCLFSPVSLPCFLP